MKHKSIVFTVLVALVAIGFTQPTAVHAECLALSRSTGSGKPFLFANIFQLTARDDIKVTGKANMSDGTFGLAITTLGRVPVGNQDVSSGSSSGGGSAGGH
jgi:hypothetical protein